MTITLRRITIPPWSTIGYGLGVDEDGHLVRFAGDWHPLHGLGEALAITREPILVEVEAWQIVGVEETKG